MEQLQLLQLNPSNAEDIALDADTQEKLLNLMAAMILAIITPERRAGHDRQSS